MMPDISLCTNDECQLKQDCYRYMAHPDKHKQSYHPFEMEDGCFEDKDDYNKETYYHSLSERKRMREMGHGH